jgi:two-component system, OmpR family, sensor kinase
VLRQRRDLDPLVRRRLDQLGSFDRGLPPAAANDAAAPAQPAPKFEPLVEPVAASAVPAEVILAPETTAPTRPGIGAIVERIEAYRRARQTIDHSAHGVAPRLPLGENHVLGAPRRVRACDFATDVTGKIIWADPGAAPMLVGTTLSALGDAQLTALLRSRQLLRAFAVGLPGSAAIAGVWQIDAAPRFDPLSGAFAGYHGRLRRTDGAEATTATRETEADRVRQMLHELRTPVNAIQGFAEVIQQQLFGPTPHEYRAHAASIAGDAARILAAFEELERLARLESGVAVLGEGSADFAAILTQTIAQLEPHTRQRSVAFQIEGCTDQSAVAMAEADAQSLAWRLLATLGGAAAPGEQLSIVCHGANGSLQISFALPAALRAKTGGSLFEAGVGAVPQAISAGVFGVGFALRLARAEAAAAGGELTRVDDTLHLHLPGLTAAAARHSEGGATTGH